MNICEQVAACIEESEGVKAALAGFMQQQIGNSEGKPLSETSMSQALNQNPDTCNEDELWGACLFTIQVLNRLNMDFLETVEAATSNQEAIALFFAAIPVLETLPIDEAISAVDQIRGFVLETYLAGYDVDLESEFACELFCLALANDCKLDMDIITEYFWNRAELIPGWDNAFEGALTIISAMANWVETTGEACVVAMMASNVGILRYLNSALGMDFGRFSVQTRSGIPDDDWQNCGCTDTWLVEWDFLTTNGSWAASTIGGFNATWASGEGWYRDSVSGNPALRIFKAYTGLLTGKIVRIEIDIATPAIGSTTHQVGTQSTDADGSPSTNIQVSNTVTVPLSLYVFLVDFTPVNAGFGIYLNNFVVTNGQRYAIKRVKITGTGENPFA